MKLVSLPLVLSDALQHAMSSRRFIVDDDESLSDEPGGAAARREHDPEDESDLDGDLTSDDDNAVSRRLKRNANRRGAPVKTRSSTTAAAAKAKTAAGRGKAWDGQFERTWDQVQEDEHGTLEGAVSDLLLSNKSRRCALLAGSGQGVDRFELTHLPPNGKQRPPRYGFHPARHHPPCLPRHRPLVRHARPGLQSHLARPHPPVRAGTALRICLFARSKSTRLYGLGGFRNS